MTPKQNFLETVRWGKPEYLCTDLNGLNLMLDPLTGTYDADMKDEWGCQWGYGNREYNPMPCILPDCDVVTDISQWKEQVTVPDVEAIDYSGVKRLRIRQTGNSFWWECPVPAVCLNAPMR